MDTPTDPSARSQAESGASADASAEAPAAGPSPEPAPAGFVADTMAELRRVVWPSRQQLFSESVAVILMVTLSAFAIAAIDRFYSWANAQVFR